jgi:predicted small secreted protein
LIGNRPLNAGVFPLSGRSKRIRFFENLYRSLPMKRLALASLLGLLMVNLAGCNTMTGLGKDIKQGGEAIEKAAKENR